MDTADGESGGISVGFEEFFDESGFNIIIAINETNKIASGIF